ncbi:hypothetical protein OHS33_34145 [Streptomyces sp. NBC_00536]|uniref:hypothetical protein n=1 Tax=Streptomyces sp. NBC_00536 TaxID=2975769 RepID=UPI002E7FE46D|nr:hypothetical protein [Streptomyces sp. NBC_00536]WUC82966.1 hypothetical protein OHS33_34145 [Streptomyces sp. NBC_00536]
MRARILTGAGAVLVALLCASGCGPGHPEPASTATGCANGATAAGGEVSVTAADDGRRICLDRHGTVRVTLPGDPAPPVTVTGAGLAEVADHVFRAESAGTVLLTSVLRRCPQPTRPATMGCLAMAAWRVTVVVR